MIAARQIAFGKGAGKKEEPPAYWGLCFTAEEAGSTIAMATHSGNSQNILDVTLETSCDGEIWEPFFVGETVVTLQSIGDKVYFRAGENGNLKFAHSNSVANIPSRNYFVLTGLISASGNIHSLLNGSEETQTLDNSLNTYAFAYLFWNCSSLTTAPKFPAKELPKGCYMSMFRGCNSLSGEIEVPADGTWENKCCESMFYDCSSLNRIKVRVTSLSSTAKYTRNWLNGVAPTGTFICPTALGTNETIKRGVSYCPEGWTVINED
jgi:hypothetical protein